MLSGVGVTFGDPSDTELGTSDISLGFLLCGIYSLKDMLSGGVLTFGDPCDTELGTSDISLAFLLRGIYLFLSELEFKSLERLLVFKSSSLSSSSSLLFLPSSS